VKIFTVSYGNALGYSTYIASTYMNYFKTMPIIRVVSKFYRVSAFSVYFCRRIINYEKPAVFKGAENHFVPF
jgi:hypothetical protein